MTRHFRLVAIGLAAIACLVPSVAKASTTECVFGGPAPGFKAVRLDLPQGSSFVNTEIRGARPYRGLNTREGWHLAQGVALIRVQGGAPSLVAYRLRNEGSSPPGAVVRSEGIDEAEPRVPAPDVPFTHSWAQTVPTLAPGVYYAVAWGAGGRGVAGPPDVWGASIEVAGTHTCGAAGSGEVFDLDQGDLTGGSQLSAPGVALIEGASVSMSTTRSLVVGMIDVAVQGAGTGKAAVEYTTPAGSAEVDREVRPFIGPAGAYRFEADIEGLFPVLSMSGVSLDLSWPERPT